MSVILKQQCVCSEWQKPEATLILKKQESIAKTLAQGINETYRRLQYANFMAECQVGWPFQVSEPYATWGPTASWLE